MHLVADRVIVLAGAAVLLLQGDGFATGYPDFIVETRAEIRDVLNRTAQIGRDRVVDETQLLRANRDADRVTEIVGSGTPM